MKYLGLYGITEGKKTSYFVVSESIFDPKKEVDELYDLKGSHVRRSQRSESAPKLDQDFNRKLAFGNAKKQIFMAQITKDAQVRCFLTLEWLCIYITII